MSNHKSREQLLAEMQALRDQLAGLDAAQPDAQLAQTDEPVEDGQTRRKMIQWVTPVVLASTVLPRTLYAQGLGPPTGGGPNPTPITFPSPTVVAPPTLAPTVPPPSTTRAPTVPPPTTSRPPTAAPPTIAG